ncbi:hypothetical protein WR25_22068 [Diploscapter pachys]|uniref:Uncharacterized protein n=1 Tax=Diploscapter pachys TaxID=2018661 RepID=A0A2A2K655_9BILA|nr:hypothetical protein WR25_22068 [Diploscapter pachys]
MPRGRAPDQGEEEPGCHAGARLDQRGQGRSGAGTGGAGSRHGGLTRQREDVGVDAPRRSCAAPRWIATIVSSSVSAKAKAAASNRRNSASSAPSVIYPLPFP